MTIRHASLQKITELKNKLTQQANWEYSESLRDLDAEQVKLRAYETAYEESVHQLHSLTTEALPVQELHAWTSFMILQRAQIEQQHVVIESKANVCQGRQEVLTDRFKDEKKWLNLQERRKLEHQAFLNKISQEQLDELAVTGHRRTRG